MRVIGLMSGTSMDGIDVALIDTDGETSIDFGPQATYSYAEDERDVLRGALAEAIGLRDRAARPGRLQIADDLVTARHVAAVERFIEDKDLDRDAIDLVGFHGQTVLHRPHEALTVQIGDGQALASHLRLPVAWDFRADDVAAGGHGAPLVPVFHRALVQRGAFDRPVAIVNIGGVANLTFLAPGADPIACDTGPGNALIDDLMLSRTGQPFDADGATAAMGTVDRRALARLLDNSFFALPAPKSLDRNAFSPDAVAGLETADAAATLVAFTVETIQAALRQLGTPAIVAICGGGARNETIMRGLAHRIPCKVVTAEALGWSIEGMEAQAFAYLAARCRRGLPITFPGTTGAPHPMPGGRLSLPMPGDCKV